MWCLWSWISWSILKQILKSRMVLESACNEDFKTVLNFDIWWRNDWDIQGQRQHIIFAPVKVAKFKLRDCSNFVQLQTTLFLLLAPQEYLVTSSSLVAFSSCQNIAVLCLNCNVTNYQVLQMVLDRSGEHFLDHKIQSCLDWKDDVIEDLFWHCW